MDMDVDRGSASGGCTGHADVLTGPRLHPSALASGAPGHAFVSLAARWVPLGAVVPWSPGSVGPPGQPIKDVKPPLFRLFPHPSRQPPSPSHLAIPEPPRVSKMLT